MAIRSITKTVIGLLPLAVMGLGLIACAGKDAKTDATSLGTYEILGTSKVQADFREFNAQDLSTAREEPTGVLKMAYEHSLARFTEIHGREPQDDLETAAAICDWVAFHLRHPYFYPEDFSLPRFYVHLYPDPQYDTFYWDPAKIISYTLSFDPDDAENWPSPFCTHQNFAAAGIMNYAGLHARLCYVEGHDGLEYYSWKYKKWIWCDATFNEHFLLPLSDGTFQPLGVKELQELTLFGGLQKVIMVKHGYPDGTNPYYNYLDLHPHGFRRYAPFFYMKTLNGEGRNVNSAFIYVSCIPIPETYVPAPGEIVESELDSNSVYSRLSCVQDPLVLDVSLDALTLGDTVSPEPDGLVLNLRTWLPYAASFEIRNGDGTLWQTLESIVTPSSTSKVSSSFSMPWSSGIVSFRAKDRIGNTSDTLTILLRRS